MTNILFASDIDGTLSNRIFISKDNINTIKKFREQGNYFAVVTGRSIGNIHSNVLPLCDYFITATGSSVLDSKYNLLYGKPMAKTTVKNIIDIILNSDANHMVVHGLTDFYFKAITSDSITKQFAMKVLYGKGISFEEIMKQDIYEISCNILKGPSYLQSTYEQISQLEEVNVYKNLVSLDIVTKGSDKANGIRQLDNLKHFSKVYVMGDALNDLSMINQFDSYAMASGVKEVKQAAKHVSPSVADALREIMNTNL